jgi:tRNA-dihydrouridine synthase
MITEVGRDALTDAPNLEALRTATAIVDEEVIAAGGVRDLDDLRELLRIGVGGVVVGREVTAGRFTVEEAQDMLHGAAKASGPWSREELAEATADYRAVLDKAGDPAAGASREILDGFVRWLSGGAP